MKKSIYEKNHASVFDSISETFEALKTGATTGLNFGTFLLNNLLPVTLGNIIGGAGLVASGYYYTYLHKK